MTNSPARQKGALYLYILIAILFSATCWLVALYLASPSGYLLPSPESFLALQDSGFENSQHGWIALLFQLATYGPFLAAIIAVSVESGRVGLLELLKRTLRWRVRWIWYLAAVLLGLGIPLIPALFAWLTGAAGDLQLFAPVPLSSILILFAWQLLTSGLGEEVGWRGYLLPKLQSTGRGERPLWITGLIWAFWHFPFVIAVFLSNMAGLSLAAKLVMVPLSLAGFTITIVGTAFLHAWLYNHTESVLPPILFHALGNTGAVLFGASALANGPLAILPGIMPWVAVFVIRRKYGKDAFLPESAAQSPQTVPKA